MKNIIKAFLVIFILLFSVSCGEEETTTATTVTTAITTTESHTVNLYKANDELYNTYTINHGEELDLPMLTNDDKVYVGWGNGTDTFSGELIVTNNLDLTLVEELVTDVFDYGEIQPGQPHISINGYIGESKYLRIPETIEGLPVRYIGSDSFKDSELIELYIPNSVVSIGYYAFEGSTDLTDVIFYGDPYGITTDIMSKSEFESYMDDNSDICTILHEDDEGLVTYQEGCPIISSEVSQKIVVEDVEYISYYVQYDSKDIPDKYHQQIHAGAFKDCTSLESVVMPIGGQLVYKEAFYNTPSLVDLVFRDDHPTIKVIDHVLYNTDQTLIYYYPGGLTDTSFSVPESVEAIHPLAFYSNIYLETINIPENCTELQGRAFYNLPSLVEFVVDPNNYRFYDVDGVLFGTGSLREALVRYPENKSGTSYVIPNNIEYIGDSAFRGNKNLETIDLGNKIGFIDGGAFDNLKKLKVLDIPNTVGTVMDLCIDETSIEVIILRRSLIVDGSITKVRICQRDVNSLIEYYVPDDSINDYKVDTVWYHYADTIHPFSEYTEE